MKTYKNGKTLNEYWQPGFLIPAVIYLDNAVSANRWCWWIERVAKDRAPYGEIPQMCFNTPNPTVTKKLTSCVFGSYDCGLADFLDFLLYGFGHADYDAWKSTPFTTIRRWEAALHEILPLMIMHPYPYLTDFLEEELGRGHKKGTGFFATPMNIATMNATMIKPSRATASVLDPAAGTGNMLLAMSNYSVNLYAQDVDRTVLKGLQIHTHLYIPWMVVPMKKLLMRAPILWGDTLLDGINGHKSTPLRFFDFDNIYKNFEVAV